jgi:hypothetical protein
VTAVWWLLWSAACVAFVVWLMRRTFNEPLERDRIIADARARTGLTPPAPDNEQGTHLADHDECELIWSMRDFDPDLDAGCDRLRQAIRDQREKDGS